MKLLPRPFWSETAEDAGLVYARAPGGAVLVQVLGVADVLSVELTSEAAVEAALATLEELRPDLFAAVQRAASSPLRLVRAGPEDAA